MFSRSAVPGGDLAGAGDRRQRPAGRHGRGLRGRRRPDSPATPPATRATSRPACAAGLGQRPGLARRRTGSTASSTRPTRRSRSSSATRSTTPASPATSRPDKSAYVGRQQGGRHPRLGLRQQRWPQRQDRLPPRHGGRQGLRRQPVCLPGRRADRRPTGRWSSTSSSTRSPSRSSPGAPGVAKPDRSVNDILISLEYANGGSNPEVTSTASARCRTSAPARW